MNPKVLRLATLLLAVASLLIGALDAAGKLEGIPLVWRPTNRKDVGVVNLLGITEIKIQVEPFVDTRPDKAKFGENQEDKQPKLATTTGSVAEFCTQNFAITLRQFGLSVVPEGGEVIVGAEILEFMVTESNTYKGEVRLKVSVKRQGKTEWIGLASGTASRFGRSYKAENYYETISDSLLEAAVNAIRDEGFRKSLLAK
ncbi:MAG TPA: hypothetical protein VJU18_11980 [Vicinamibacteria bacterium]|nr:hypothetical protein [Vicinamibacteria bacterium]